jgi:hypothetical protein
MIRHEDPFLARSIETTVAVAALIALPWIGNGDLAAAGGWVAGVVGSLALIEANRRILRGAMTPARRAMGSPLGRVVFLKILIAGGYLTFVFHGCNLSPFHFVAGFTLLLAVMALKALLSAFREGSGSPMTPKYRMHRS